ncbi:MAG: YXWGXW repeat-containing protein [Chitinophagaceae bacterium]|nr:YXWGXW repeat-containing protein [Chitinophagaceae bacterium]MCW5925754.1 YXWGXW repeat-containing protein [Chitinophagaceae bacterium]
MRTVFTTLGAITLVLFLFSSCRAQSRVYVAARPATVMAPPPPFRGAVWIGPEYQLHRGAYVYVPPRYVTPRRGHVWVSGHWDHHRGKQVWVKGKWVKHNKHKRR